MAQIARFLPNKCETQHRVVLVQRPGGWELWMYGRERENTVVRRLPVAYSIAEALWTGCAAVVERDGGVQYVMAD